MWQKDHPGAIVSGLGKRKMTGFADVYVKLVRSKLDAAPSPEWARGPRTAVAEFFQGAGLFLNLIRFLAFVVGDKSYTQASCSTRGCVSSPRGAFSTFFFIHLWVPKNHGQTHTRAGAAAAAYARRVPPSKEHWYYSKCFPGIAILPGKIALYGKNLLIFFSVLFI
jgi:hypothetical protein